MASRSLTYVILGQDKLTPVLNKAGKEAEKTGGTMSGALSKASVAWLALGAAAGGVISKVISDARALNAVPLQQAAKNAGISWSNLKPKVDAAGQSMSRLGFDQAQTNTAMLKLITATGSSKSALAALGGVADFARYKHLSLADASLALARAAGGNTRAFKDLGISTSDLPKHFATTGTAASRLDIVMGLLNKKIGGQAAAYAGTFGGKLEVMKAQLTDVSASIGVALLPVLSTLLGTLSTNLIPALQKFGAWFTKDGAPALQKFAKTAMPMVNFAVGLFSTGISACVKGFQLMPGPLKLATVAIIALGVAMKLASAVNPWFALAMGIILVVGIIVKYWPQISAAFKVAWDYIMNVWNICKTTLIDGFNTVKNFVLGVWSAFANSFPGKIIIALVKLMWALIIIEFNIAKAIIVGVFTSIKDTATLAWNIVYTVFKTIWDTLLHPLWNVVAAIIKAIFTAIIAVATIAWKAIATIFTTMWNSLLKPAIMFLWTTISTVFGFIINGAAKAFGWIPGIGGALKGAASAFNAFRDNVNNALNGLNNKTVNVSVAMTAATNPYPGGISGRAADGRKIKGPGGPTSDTAGLFALSNDEWVIRASSSNKYGYAAMSAVNRGDAVIGFAGGGGVNVNATAPSATSIQKTSWDAMVKLVQAAYVSSPATGGGGAPPSGGGGAVGSGVARWTSVVAQALALLGQSQSWISTVLRRMNQESGGNQYAINNWDSNAAAGTPSMGLMQTIGPTFNAYAGPYRGLGIYNALANVYAGLNYAIHRYGSLSALNRAGGYALGGAVSFDRGGFLPPHSTTMAINGTSAWEPVGKRGGGGNTFIVNVDVRGHALASKQEIGRTVADALREFKGKGGNI
jgi:phage-related protein